MPRDLAETLALSVVAAAAAAAACVMSGGGLLLGFALYSGVGSLTLLALSMLTFLEDRLRVSRAEQRAYI